MTYHSHNDFTLENIARRIILQYDPDLLRNPAPIPVDAIMEKVYGLTLVFHHIRNNGRILGETVFEDAMIPIYERKNREGYKLIPVKAGTVIIDSSLLNCQNDGQFYYTCGHELVHWVIDKKYFTELGETAAMTKVARSSELDRRIERQADRMTSYLLMPKGTIKMAFYRNRQEKDVVAVLAELFNVSRQAMKIRLTEMGLLQ